MNTLYLLRHAKSAWDDPSLADHERPLSPRGREAVRRLEHHVVEARLWPELVLCSSAVRARDTYQPLSRALGEPETSVEDGLYAASTEELLGRLHQVPEGARRVMVVGHNPGLGELALALAGDGDPAALSQLQDNFPTGALATLSFAGPWRQLASGVAYLESLVVARQFPSHDH